jgi:hypothetical protein
VLDHVLQLRLIPAGGIEKRTPGLRLHINGVAEQLLNGLPLLAHFSHPVQIGELSRRDLGGKTASQTAGEEGQVTKPEPNCLDL